MHRWLLLGLVACGHPAPKPPPTNTVAVTPPDAVPIDAPGGCHGYQLLMDQVDACTALDDETRQRLQQIQTDTGASISEMGMDGASPFDPDEHCDESAEITRKLAGEACKL